MLTTVWSTMLVSSLRERSHEFMNKLHVILGLLHLKSYSI